MNTGVPFEMAVAAVQSLLDPNTTVAHNERLRDRLGHLRQYDVVVRGTLGGREMLGVIECKDWTKRVGAPEVNAFADKAANLRANLKIIASRNGFTAGAIEVAKHHGIGTVSLLRDAPSSTGVAIALPSYAAIYRWSRYRIVFPDPLPDGFEAGEAPAMLLRGLSLQMWAVHALEVLKEMREVGMFQIEINFADPELIQLSDAEFRLSRIIVEAERTIHKKVKVVDWYGKGFYEWSEQRIIGSKQEEFVTEWFRTDFSDWEEFQGEIPPAAEESPLEMRIELFEIPELVEQPVRLTELATVKIAQA